MTFDRKKEEFAVLHYREGTGKDFRMLGPIIDVKLQMGKAVAKMTKKARPKLTALIRCMRFYDVNEMVQQFKTHILCVLESCTGAVYHAATSVLEPLDRVMGSFLRQIDLDDNTAFLEFNLAHLALRRDIAMLGLLHKCALGLAHKDLQKLFPAAPEWQKNMRTSVPKHSRQIWDRCYKTNRELDIFHHSVFGLVKVYNRLPQDCVDQENVKEFQRKLTELAKMRCKRQKLWINMFSPRGIVPRKF